MQWAWIGVFHRLESNRKPVDGGKKDEILINDSFRWYGCEHINGFTWFHRILLSCNCIFMNALFCYFVMLGGSSVTFNFFFAVRALEAYSFTSDCLKFLLWWVTLNWKPYPKVGNYLSWVLIPRVGKYDSKLMLLIKVPTPPRGPFPSRTILVAALDTLHPLEGHQGWKETRWKQCHWVVSFAGSIFSVGSPCVCTYLLLNQNY